MKRNRTGNEDKASSKATVSADTMRALFSQNKIDHQHEKVLRMKYGISEPDSHELHFRGGNNQELQTRLAMMEQLLMQQLAEGKPETPDETPVRDSILNKLKNMR